ncbi:hypothetical protein AKJ43_01635 [candidate division MSBL1 archaeon SCGC-AAA261D19]|uniref:RecF/RecN/SMC N-terminal domain-containing protein n=1 Tax=candidate division MSBL1 archaeon SCGC-AAA261D19 TaxID=1698273 RepID=A0A133V7T6_9EURY|nr:hypothetical protein AKJ43_01635 [candidate division MSBL1 archaeon SCGC-AAA261D19]
MRGFKSFGHEKVTLPLSSGLTAIIGPNGCGKSNVVEALSFALGQASSRSLRASRFSDLIYHGEDGENGKKPAPFAKVSLYFENDDGALPIDSERIKITRKVKRDGKCTYRINGKRTTRQEIVELLSGEISEPAGHNFIMQGDIDNFIKISSTERREIIDDLAGVAEFDEKKSKTLKELEDVKSELRGERGRLDEIEQQLSELKKEREDALSYKKLHKDLLEKKGFLAHLRFKSHKKNLDRIRKEIKKRDRKVSELEERKQKIESKKSEYESRRSKIEELIEEKRNSEVFSRMYEARSRVETLQKELNSARSDFEELKSEIEKLREKLKKTAEKNRKRGPIKEIERLFKKFEKLHEKFDGLTGELISEEEGSQPEVILPKIKQIIDKLSSVVSGLDEYLQSILETREKFLGLIEDTGEMGEVGSELQRVKSDLTAAEARYSDVKERIQRLKKKIKNGKNLLQEAEKVAEDVRKSIDKHGKKLKQLEAKISDLESKSSNLRAKVRKLQDEKQDLKLKEATVETELKGAKDEKEKYKSVAGKPPETDPKVIEKRIRKIEGKIQKLKPVNERAIDKYEEVKERCESQRKHYEKIEEEKERIQEFIDEIDQRKTEVFMETFEEISRNFSEIFSELSPGGSGSLVLDNPERPFEGGLGIEVKPSGKKLRRAISLSGGERALTGVAFIFAIQRARPSSFYVLDEIDAHLDPENQKRVADMVKRSAEESQVIVVTFKDAMMSVGDRLFGVIMDESDISHIVSVDLENLD